MPLSSRLATSTALSLLMSVGIFTGVAVAQEASVGDETTLDTIVISAEQQTKQSLGVSVISAENLETTPVVNDISEIVRKMPGVNLTGNTTTGQRGNQRQIDIRGMGPENTLILIDGKPVNSRNAVRMGRMGERDTRGDSQWVAPELIERIEVIRGPAAARYGSGAAGGVVNIITKRPETAMGQVALRYNAPQHSDEGETRRVNLMYALPLTQNLHARFNANWNKTDPDAIDINKKATLEEGGTEATVPAGREGVENKDFDALLTWEPVDGQSIDFEFAFSRQGNRYAGDTQNSNLITEDRIQNLYGKETNKMYRQTFGVTHRGDYAFGESFSYLQFERTRNTRMPEGTAGGPEGSITQDSYDNSVFKTIKLDNLSGKTEWTMPGNIGGKHLSLTLGADFRYEKMDDAVSNTQSIPGIIPGTTTDPDSRDSTTDQTLLGLYAESNIVWNDALTLTPALRLDHADTFGDNISPSLNATYQLNDNWQMKAGIARAFKAPNLYQLNPNYVYTSMGNGCTNEYDSATQARQCFIIGNADLKPETSVNTEIGVAYDSLNGTNATFTAFHNNFRNYIMGGLTEVGTFVNPSTGLEHRYYKWENVPRAKISGLEASFSQELREDLRFAVNATYMIQSKNETTGDPLSLIPKYTINASVDWMVTEQFTVTPSASFYGKTKARTTNWSNPERDPTGTDLEPRDPYAIANINLKYDFANGATLIGGVTNLFDERLERTGNGANTYNEPGRAFYIGITKTF
ncbi:FepA family TonB-dependent siderophore receptor [Paenirhodobacter populi]|uniref:TonB-dependent siderophore receptor n=1 Tax=Paenirhodobacter populi TaxID=2306993 RepID=A0A443K0K0_9RHOB|nr:FepA family TonB-dependent siderophore receptor [Sinirhodobacter populi]RWR16327.1 TonB-dependent siderophore receptor [Sinirhodobacter populi]RWR26307.1 TonB-dependent siderophore receptor [Sinirhodobacter populi]